MNRKLQAPEQLETARLRLRRPVAEDAAVIFDSYASDPEVTRWLSWPCHVDPEDTIAFLEMTDEEWRREGVGAYLITSMAGSLLGSTGLHLETRYRAVTGYVLTKHAWGKGFATEALQAMVRVTEALSIGRLSALVHPEHTASIRVLEKCGFELEGHLRAHTEFPNLMPGVALDVLSYSIVFS